MRIVVRGKVGRERMHEIADLVSDFLAAHGVIECCGFNVYLTPMDSETSEHVEIIGADGEELEGITISNPNAVRRRREGQLRLVKG